MVHPIGGWQGGRGEQGERGSVLEQGKRGEGGQLTTIN